MYEEIRGYCIYCKEEISINEPYVTVGENYYHTECFDLIKEELEENGIEIED